MIYLLTLFKKINFMTDYNYKFNSIVVSQLEYLKILQF